MAFICHDIRHIPNVVLMMAIQERKLRKIGNSVVVTLSKEFLESIGASGSDIVYVDEEKLKEAFAKKSKGRASKKIGNDDCKVRSEAR